MDKCTKDFIWQVLGLRKNLSLLSVQKVVGISHEASLNCQGYPVGALLQEVAGPWKKETKKEMNDPILRSLDFIFSKPPYSLNVVPVRSTPSMARMRSPVAMLFFAAGESGETALT